MWTLPIGRNSRTWIPSTLLFLEHKYYPKDSHVWILGSQLVALSWDAVEPLRWETWLAKIGQLEMELCEFQLSLISAPCLSVSCQSSWLDQLLHVPIVIPSLGMMDWVPSNHEQKQILPSCTYFCQHMVTDTRKGKNPLHFSSAAIWYITVSSALLVHRNRRSYRTLAMPNSRSPVPLGKKHLLFITESTKIGWNIKIYQILHTRN